MTDIRTILSVFALMLGITQMNAQNMEALKWLEGEWEMTDSKSTTTENWNLMNDSTLIGESETSQNGTVVFSEKLSIEYRDSTYRYVAVLPFKTATFLLRSIGAETMTFEDPKNDFPSLIKYTLNETGLEITLEGSGKSQILQFTKK